MHRYRADAHTDWVLEYLEEQSKDDPFFLFVSYIEPHHQNDHECYEGPKGSKEYWANYEIPGDLAGLPGDWVKNFPDYLGCCNALDNAVGRVNEKLKELGLADNTLAEIRSRLAEILKSKMAEANETVPEILPAE